MFNILKKLIRIILPPLFHPKGYGMKELHDIIFYTIGKIKFSESIKYEKNTKYSRLSIIIKSISKFNFSKCKYLEIGVSTGKIFMNVPINKQNKYGVDPDAASSANYVTTSDNFFKNNKKKFNVIFIDGLHTYEQCQKDCINSLNRLENKGIIILHDLIPENYIDEYTPRKTLNYSWTGDVWKVAVELSRSNNMNFFIANCDKGVGILIPQKNYCYIKMPELKSKRFKDFYKNYYKKLPIVKPEKAIELIDKLL